MKPPPSLTVRRIASLLLFVSTSAWAVAAPTLTLTRDTASAGPRQFAEEEIRREAAARGIAVADANLGFQIRFDLIPTATVQSWRSAAGWTQEHCY